MSVCPLCEHDGGALIVRADRWRVIRVTDMPAFPAFYRVVWNAHVAELSDLSAAERTECLEAVVAVERLLREHLAPTKVNLAALGNVVPHLHWHVVGRFDWDSHFPQPLWAPAVRPADDARLLALADVLPTLDAAIARTLGSG